MNQGGILMKHQAITLLVSFMLLLSACSTNADPKAQAVDVYQAALESIMEWDEALNHDMSFIAIDMSEFTEIDEAGKNAIIDFFSAKYAVDVMDATFEQLEEQKRFNPETLSLEGVLLRIEAIDMDGRDVVFEGSKYKSGLGAVGGKGVVTYKNGQWQIKEARTTWIS